MLKKEWLKIDLKQIGWRRHDTTSSLRIDVSVSPYLRSQRKT
ncbi:hypothetical protein MFUM_560005 [Methylacidiphilum fumariolicum SolV]|uniref:Uncharacterized protein n=2 Tax=Candidatus Methylacidiphilum fumarolicum TaxID=591154 RepID=I0JYG5_METFB|nr:conserved protein of unknown function [Candidatus Methylacidiphilum fumarolicum]CCG92284.1 hypothetical protein MFUM_560005 [Methylacidiphilum fumariolicum SolV]